MNRSDMLPDDQYNRTLLDHVHPLDWQNPEPTGRYNLVVLGGGTAGLISAAVAASMGARTALIERGFLGGDCLNVGCVPSKGLIRGARGQA
ncbi:MAG TPA: FAD-dependent oxidoreductase, partial [Alkalispirochaeta sp.]|nr:FAD-dependent oxidoreductase [Alkalispirochaeta sp.]